MSHPNPVWGLLAEAGVTHSYDDDCVPPHPEPGEVIVTCGLEDDLWPAEVDPTDERWNGFLSPAFRPSVARRMAAYQEKLAAENDEADQLILSPDGRTLVHLVDDEYPDSVSQSDYVLDPLGKFSHSVWAVYDLSGDEHDDAARIRIGAWHWTWTLAEPGDDDDDDRRVDVVELT
jgi:hypothetical protein